MGNIKNKNVKKIDAIEMDYSELDKKFDKAMAYIETMPLHKISIAKYLKLYPSDITHKNNGRSKYSPEQKQKVLDLVAAVGLRCTNLV